MLQVLGFFCAVIIGIIIGWMTLLKGDTPYSAGYEEGYSDAQRKYHDYTQGFADGVTATFDALVEAVTPALQEKLQDGNSADDVVQ